MHTIRITDELYGVLAASAEHDTRSVTEQLSHILKQALRCDTAASTQQIAVDTQYAPGDLRNTMSSKEISDRIKAMTKTTPATQTNSVSKVSEVSKVSKTYDEAKVDASAADLAAWMKANT